MIAYCPTCAGSLALEEVEQDVGTAHCLYSCGKGHWWVETLDDQGELLHITTPAEGEDEDPD